MGAQAITGSFSAVGQSASFRPGRDYNTGFNLSLWGAFSGKVQLERSFDAGATWLPVTAMGVPLAYTAPCSEMLEEPEEGVYYRLNCTARASGTINYRLSE